ncbi:SDR family oxidoreductase [Bacillus sp. S34]|nr:SDR family oxidoreductase [Bacillus sp. S34]
MRKRSAEFDGEPPVERDRTRVEVHHLDRRAVLGEALLDPVQGRDRARVEHVRVGHVDHHVLGVLRVGEAGDEVVRRREEQCTADPVPDRVLVDGLADAVLFLGSPRSSYVTGAELYVDGGASQV